MFNDLAAQLQKLQDLRSLIGEASYADSLLRLRVQYGDAAVDSQLHQLVTPASTREQNQTIHNTTPNQGAQGIFYGNVYLYGQRGKDATALLASYLQHQRQRCSSLPLQGVYEQKANDDILKISLEQVYTQLATTELIEREQRVDGDEDYQDEDLAIYLQTHVCDHVLPIQQRVEVEIARHWGPGSDWEPWTTDTQRHRLRDIAHSIEALTAYLSTGDMLLFYGPQLVTETIAANQHLVLLGEPGSGKSTALRYLALALAQAGLDESFDLTTRLPGWARLGNQGSLLPLFLPLLPFARKIINPATQTGTADDLWNHIAADLEKAGRFTGLAAVVHDELEAGRVLLMLDGLDEIAGPESRLQVVRAVQAFGVQYPQCRIVVTCRVRAYEGGQNREWQLGWPTATLADWTLGQMQYFVQAWYLAAASGEMRTEQHDKRIATLQEAIVRRDDLKRLGIRPLLLTIMALVHYNDGQLPEERVGLYSRCVDLLLGQWELTKANGSGYGKLTDYIGLPDTDVKALRPLLHQAAFRAHTASSSDDPGSLERATLRAMVAEALEQRGHTQPFDGADRFLDYTDGRAGLLQASAAGEHYIFPHLTFQEYLAGLELVRDVEFVQGILERRYDDRWRVPIQLGLGHLVSEGALAMAYQLLSELVYLSGRSDEQHQRDLLFASELAEDVGWVRLECGGAMFKKLRDDLAQALVSVVEGTTLPAPERVQAGAYLCDLGDPRPGVTGLPPEMVRIEGQTFIIGITADEAEEIEKAYEQYFLDRGDSGTAQIVHSWAQDEINDQALTLPTFELARYPLTNAQYQQFVADGGYDLAAPWWDASGKTWLGRDDQATEGLERWQKRHSKKYPEWWNHEHFGRSRPNHPVVGISWYEAVAFCRWLTQYLNDSYIYRLPSEVEWEYAARRATRRRYPWGNDAPHRERANFDKIYDGTTTVGCFALGATPEEGIHDLTGNVWEWTCSEYRDYPYAPNDGRETMDNPTNKCFISRGGSWWINIPLHLRTSYRPCDTPDGHHFSFGFRLARNLSEY